MKRIQSLTALLLTLFLMAGLCVLPSSAKAVTSASGKTYRNVVVIGDSICTGFRMKNADGTRVDYTFGARTKGSYPDIVARRIKATSFVSYAREGSSTNELRMLLDDQFVPDPYFRETSGRVIEMYYGGEQAFQALQSQIHKDLKKADLILLNGGSNDLFATVNTTLKHVMNGEAEPVSAILECAYRGSTNFMKNWGPIVEAIRKDNPRAELVAVGLYNGAEGLTVIPGNVIHIGQVLSPIFDSMNEYVRVYGRTTGSYQYVDIHGVDTEPWPDAIPLLAGGEFYDTMLICTHPTRKGHKWIAHKILKVI